jgi:hypothetical protein
MSCTTASGPVRLAVQPAGRRASSVAAAQRLGVALRDRIEDFAHVALEARHAVPEGVVAARELVDEGDWIRERARGAQPPDLRQCLGDLDERGQRLRIVEGRACGCELHLERVRASQLLAHEVGPAHHPAVLAVQVLEARVDPQAREARREDEPRQQRQRQHETGV